MSYGQNFVLTLFTNDVELARRADAAGIDRIGLDLEKIGKAERQGHLSTWISDHEEYQLPKLRRALNRAKLFARTNPIHPDSGAEIERLLQAGVEVLMLPMFHSVWEAEDFVEMIAGRAEVSLLLETATAAARVEQIVKIPGIDEIHIGLNDLYLSLQLSNHFELLGSQLMEMLSAIICKAGIPFGFGGVGRVADERLPMPSDLVYAQYPRLNGNRALVSRVFTSPDYTALDLEYEVQRFRDRMDIWYQREENELQSARQDMVDIAEKLWPPSFKSVLNKALAVV